MKGRLSVSMLAFAALAQAQNARIQTSGGRMIFEVSYAIRRLQRRRQPRALLLWACSNQVQTPRDIAKTP